MHPNASYFITIFCLTEDNFICEGESAGAQLIKWDFILIASNKDE